MAQIIVNNSYSKISGLTPLEEKTLRTELSYTVGGKSSWFSSYGPRKKSLLSKKGEFPTGLLQTVLKLNFKIKIIDNRSRPASKPGMFKLDLK